MLKGTPEGVSFFGCMASYPPRVPGKQGSRRWRSEATTDSLHHFLPNVRFTELRSREGKSTVRKQVGPPYSNLDLSDAYVHCIRFDEALKVYILI